MNLKRTLELIASAMALSILVVFLAWDYQSVFAFVRAFFLFSVYLSVLLFQVSVGLVLLLLVGQPLVALFKGIRERRT